MNIPAFTAEASLYRTMGRYRSSVSEGGDLALSGELLVPAYIPGKSTMDACQGCVVGCQIALGGCLTIGAVKCGLGCGPTLIFYGFCFAGCMGTVMGICLGAEASCMFGCGIACCPKLCGAPNPLGYGDGCCDENEQCVRIDDPNSRQGCCPSDQIVCGGKCCAKGETLCCGDTCCPPAYTCCGETCCPPGYFCRHGWSCERYFIGDFPNTPPPKPPETVNNCIFGGEPCGRKCCPPGLQCCHVNPAGQPDCRTSCMR